jgi:hypothetical protein
MLGRILKQFFCEHRNSTWLRNIYGDEINYHNGKRSLWKCDECEKITFGDWLYEPTPTEGKEKGGGDAHD